VPVVYERVTLDPSGKELLVQTMVVDDGDGRKLYFVMRTEPHDQERRHIVHFSNRPIEGRAGDHGFFRHKIVGPQILNTPEGPKKGYQVEVQGAHGLQHCWQSEDDMMFLEETPDPANDEEPTGKMARGVLEALRALYPEGIRQIRVTGKERDNAVLGYLVTNDMSRPVNIARAVQRALETLKKENPELWR
jgi:hypothetical protein